MKKWEKKLIKDFKSGATIYSLADEYAHKIGKPVGAELPHENRETIVEDILRDWMTR